MSEIKWSMLALSVLLLLLVSFLSGCAPGVTFKVVDATTGKPIEGAYTAAWWTARKGFGGFSSGYTKKVVESVTDSEGTFSIPAYGGSFTATPRIKVYKPGYVGWDSRRIYLGKSRNYKGSPYCISRENYRYTSQAIMLDPWPLDNPDFSYQSHDSFLSDGIPSDLSYQLNISAQINKHEVPKVRRERKENKNE